MPSRKPARSVADNADELFDTYTEAGVRLTPERRARVHAQGIWHCAVNVMLFRSSGTLVLQQRAATKRVCPLAWDLSVAEHLQVNEGWEAAARRGLAEELGLTNAVLAPWGDEIQERHIDLAAGIHNYEFQRCYRAESDAEIFFDAAEVAAVREVTPAEFKREALAEPAVFTPWLLTWAKLLGPFD